MQGFGGITKRYRAGAYADEPRDVVTIDQAPRDGIWLFQRMVQVLAGVTVATIFLVLAVGCGASDIDVTAALVAAADARKANVRAEDRAAVILLSHPLPYAATVTQSGDGIAEPRTRFYVAKSVKEAQ